MCGKDEAQREVYKLKEEPERGDRKRKEKKRRTKKQRKTREKKVRKESGRIHRRKIFVRPT